MDIVCHCCGWLDLACIAGFIVVNAASLFVGSLFFLSDADSMDPRAARMHTHVLAYGSAQSLIGFLGGFYLCKLLLVHMHRRPRPEYAFVRSDDDFLID